MANSTQVDWTSDYFTYRAIWNAAVNMHRRADDDGAEGLECLMSAAVLANTAYEGFNNHLIDVLYPDVWVERRRVFGTGEFRGRLGKTRFLAARLGVSLDRVGRPYTGVAELSAWRNQLVHPGTKRKAGVARADLYSRKPKTAKPEVLATLVRPGFVADSFADVEALADMLLHAATEQHWSEVGELGESAFWGPTFIGGASLQAVRMLANIQMEPTRR
jgi:hypothetical protein